VLLRGTIQNIQTPEVGTRNIPARSSHVFTTRLFTVSVLITCARLVGLKSPVRELTDTSFKLIFARTDVKRTSESLYHIRKQKRM
jgi:hypothetical protein